MSRMQPQAAKCGLEHAELCRASRKYLTASIAILEAVASGDPDARVEMTKNLWSTGEHDKAILELQPILGMPANVLGKHVRLQLSSATLPCTPLPTTEESNNLLGWCKTLLIFTRWIHKKGYAGSTDIYALYHKVTKLQPDWEKGHFRFAKFLDDFHLDARKRQEENNFTGGVGSVHPSSAGSSSTQAQDRPWLEIMPAYGNAVHHGNKNLFQALSRMLTL